jgi:hypothetical protein
MWEAMLQLYALTNELRTADLISVNALSGLKSQEEILVVPPLRLGSECRG